MNAQKKRQLNENANVIDGKLILSFPMAVTPVVWQFDLSDAKSASFEVQEEGKAFALTIRTAGATKKETVAVFGSKDEAVAALMATSSALTHSYGQPAYSAAAPVAMHAAPANAPAATAPMYAMPYPSAPQKKGVGKWIVVALCLCIIGFLFFALAKMQPSIATTAGTGGKAAQAQGAATSGAADTSGVAVSADDFLRSR